MKINNISFKSTQKISYINKPNNSGTTQVYHTTWLDRDGRAAWDTLVRFMVQEFKNENKVNIYDVACSDGTECYSLAISLREVIPTAEEREKFSPICGSDFSQEVINRAKSGKIDLKPEEVELLNFQTSSRFNYFIDSEPFFKTTMSQPYKTYTPNSYLRNSVFFQQKDIVSKLKEINSNDASVVIIRNVLPYLEENYIQEILSLLDQKLKPGSLVFIGDLEVNTRFWEALQKNFKLLDGNKLFKKLAHHR